MVARPVALFAHGIRSAGSAAGLTVALLVGIGLLGLAVNWLMLLVMLPPASILSSGARVLFFGIAFPLGWVMAAKPFAIGKGLQRFYRNNRDQVLSLIAGTIEREAGAVADPAPDHWLRAVDGLRAQVDRFPRLVRPLVGLGLRRIGLDAIERALGTGSGPAALRIAGAIVARVETELAGSASMLWLWGVGAANLFALVAVYLIS